MKSSRIVSMFLLSSPYSNSDIEKKVLIKCDFSQTDIQKCLKIMVNLFYLNIYETKLELKLMDILHLLQ